MSSNLCLEVFLLSNSGEELAFTYFRKSVINLSSVEPRKLYQRKGERWKRGQQAINA